MTPTHATTRWRKAREALELGRNVAHRLLDYNNMYDKEAVDEFLEALSALPFQSEPGPVAVLAARYGDPIPTPLRPPSGGDTGGD